MLIGNSWTNLRIGILASVHASANIAGTPRLAFGVCSGNQGYSTSLDAGTNLIGVRQSQSSYNFTANGGDSYVSGGFESFKRVSGTVTPGSSVASVSGVIAAKTPYSWRTGLFLDLVKGSPNYTISMMGITNLTGFGDLSETDFLSLMEGGTYGQYTTGATHTLAMSEAGGDLDSLFFYWNRSSPIFSLDAVAYRRLA